MGWADWMVVNMSLEDELQLERQARAILHHDDHAEIAELCFSLIKQTHYQQILLSQAVGRITELETQDFIEELDEEPLETPAVSDADRCADRERSWWQRLLPSN